MDYNITFAGLLEGVETLDPPSIYKTDYPDTTLLIDPFFPEGFRREFYGP